MLLPKALFPEAEALHVLVVVTEWCETKRRSLQWQTLSRQTLSYHLYEENQIGNHLHHALGVVRD